MSLKFFLTMTFVLACAVLCIMITIPMAQSPPIIQECGCCISLREGKMHADCSNTTDLKCLSQLRNVESLNLSGIGLKEVPKDLNLTGFENVLHLDLSNNNISNISTWKFDGMPQLQSLDLSHNLITKLPEEACRINSVDLSYNRLTDMSNLVGIFKTKARIRGNPILCACNSAIAKRFYAQPRVSRLEEIDCILPGSNLSKPLSTQCSQEFNKEQGILNSVAFYIVLFLFLGLFAAGIILLCMWYVGS